MCCHNCVHIISWVIDEDLSALISTFCTPMLLLLFPMSAGNQLYIFFRWMYNLLPFCAGVECLLSQTGQSVCSITLKIWLTQLFFVVFSLLHPQDFCSPEAPFPPVNSSGLWLGGPPSPFVLLPNSSILAWGSNASYYTPWPPLSALRLLASLEGQSCVTACQNVGLICEPALYRFINIKEAFSA